MKQEFSPPEWVPREAWNEWLMVRKKKRAPLTEYALRLAVKHLDELRREGYTPQVVLDNCILQGWQGIWPPHELNGGKNGSSKHQQRERSTLEAIRAVKQRHDTDASGDLRFALPPRSQ